MHAVGLTLFLLPGLTLQGCVHQARIHLTDLLTSRHIPGLLASQEVVMKEKLATPGPKVRHKGWEKNETIGWAKFLDVEGYPNE